MNPEPTPSQTIGPFFHDAVLYEDRSELVPPDHPRAIRIEGAVYDGAGEPVTDAMIEVWQANQGSPPDSEAFPRGLLKCLVTRVYFPDEVDANSSDPVLYSIENFEFRRTLVARDEGEVLRFDIHLQGHNQTAFFELQG